MASPADDYVREFTEDVPRYKVLSVGKVMRAPDSVKLNGGPTVHVDAKLDSLIEVASSTEGVLPVVDDQGELVGEISQSMILKAMSTK